MMYMREHIEWAFILKRTEFNGISFVFNRMLLITKYTVNHLIRPTDIDCHRDLYAGCGYWLLLMFLYHKNRCENNNNPLDDTEGQFLKNVKNTTIWTDQYLSVSIATPDQYGAGSGVLTGAVECRYNAVQYDICCIQHCSDWDRT